MRSPVANKKQMIKVDLEEGLLAYQCPETNGVFLPVTSYFRWLGKQLERSPHLPSLEGSQEELVDSQDVKICPESGQIMQRYSIGHDFKFHIDRSPSGSLWFDKGEWEALRKRQYHDELHLIFTAPWQRKVRTEQKDNNERAMLEDKLGSSLLDQLDSLRREIEGHHYRDAAIAYLQR